MLPRENWEEPMPVDEEAVKLGARLVAIEYAICELFSAVYRDIKPKDIHQRHDQLIEYFRKRPMKGDDPAMSDLLSGEVEIALHRLLTKIESHMKLPRRRRGGE
jgi:hypothetical protein